MADYTTTELLAKVRRYGVLPSYDEGSDTNLLALLNDEQLTYLTQQLERTREEYRTATLDIAVTAGRLTYPIPTRAITAGIKQIQGVDTSGNLWGMWELRPQDWPSQGIWTSPCRRFYLQGNFITWYADPPAGSIRVTYPLRMSELVPVSIASTNYSTITAIDTATKTLTVSPAFANGGLIADLVRSTPHFDILSMDAVFSGSATTTLVFSATLPTGLAVGDYVCLPGKSPVCQAPLELHSLLAQHVAYVVLESKGDPKAVNAAKLRDETAMRILTLLQPRPQRARAIVNRQAPGFWRGWPWNNTRGQ